MNFHFFFYRELAGYLLLGMLDEADGGYTKAKVTTKKHKEVIPACCNELDTSENILTLEDICHDHLGYSSKQILISRYVRINNSSPTFSFTCKRGMYGVTSLPPPTTNNLNQLFQALKSWYS